MPNERHFKTHEDYLNWYREYREKNREKLREYIKEYNKNWRQKYGYYNENNWKDKNWDKVLVEKRLQKAVKLGKIQREPCEICGEEKSQGHHPDYNKPLKVIWLCSLHHKKIHTRN